MILCIILILLIPVADLIVLKFAQKPSYALYTHLCLTLLGACYCVYLHHTALIEHIHSVRLLPAAVCAVCGIVIYITDLTLKNMILHDVLILDWRYYFSPKKGMHISVLLSVLIACGEELIFRLPICVLPVQKLVLLLIGAVAYGIAHLFFSRYDACSKIIIGLLLGICVIWTKNIYVAVIIHTVYNIAVGFWGGSDHADPQESLQTNDYQGGNYNPMNIVVKNVTKSYQKLVLKDISLNIDKPGVYLIAGPNGSGKTTLLETIVGLRQADSGTIRVNGHPNGSIAAKKSLGFLCQQNGLRKTIKLKEEMQLVKEVFGVEVDDMEYLKKYNLQEYYRNRTRTLSGGTQRRFLTAMLFLAGQDIVILDEPASGLDTYSRDEIWNTISEYGKEHIVIVSDHYLNQARLYSDRIILLDSGSIIANADFETIKKECLCETLIKVRQEHFKPVLAVIDGLGADYEVKVSGTVCNIYLKNKVNQVLATLADQKITSHSLDLEDIYFYMTGKQSHEEEGQ